MYTWYRENDLHKSMASFQRLSDATEAVSECLLRLQNSLREEDPLFGDVQTVQVLTNEHRVRMASNSPAWFTTVDCCSSRTDFMD